MVFSKVKSDYVISLCKTSQQLNSLRTKAWKGTGNSQANLNLKVTMEGMWAQEVVVCLYAENWSERQEESDEVGDRGASAGEMSRNRPLVMFFPTFLRASPSQQSKTQLIMSTFSALNSYNFCIKLQLNLAYKIFYYLFQSAWSTKYTKYYMVGAFS